MADFLNFRILLRIQMEDALTNATHNVVEGLGIIGFDSWFTHGHR